MAGNNEGSKCNSANSGTYRFGHVLAADEVIGKAPRISILLMVQKSGDHQLIWYDIPLFTGFYTSQVMQDFSHQLSMFSLFLVESLPSWERSPYPTIEKGKSSTQTYLLEGICSVSAWRILLVPLFGMIK